MRRPLWVRALIGIWGLWFTAALSELGGLHTCPVHDGTAAIAAASHASHTAHAQMVGGHAGHAAHLPAPNGGHDHSNACSCLGSCCCCAPVSGPVASVAFIDVEVVASHPLAYAEVPPPNFARTYAQPYPNGPPARG